MLLNVGFRAAYLWQGFIRRNANRVTILLSSFGAGFPLGSSTLSLHGETKCVFGACSQLCIECVLETDSATGLFTIREVPPLGR